MPEPHITITKSRSVGMSELINDFWTKEMRIMHRIPFMKYHSCRPSLHADPEHWVKLNLERIEKEVLARGGRYFPLILDEG